MQKEYPFDTIYKKFSQRNAGILFINIATKRIEISLKLIEYFLHDIEYVIWIAPSNFLRTLIYTNEIKKNCQKFRHRIKYYAAESISVSDSKYLDLYNLINNHRTFCVIDESLTIKNSEAGRTKRLLFLSPYFTYKLILSSAPVTQGLIDLYSQLEFLDTKILKMSEQQFNHIFMPYKYQNYMIMKHWSRSQDENNILQIMKPYILGYDIDKKYIINHYNYDFELTPREKESYQQEKLKYIQSKNRLVFLQVVQNFQKIYTVSQNKLYGLQKVLHEILDRQEKALIYLKFRDELDIIKETKILHDIPFIELTKRTNKRKAIKAFERDANIMFCTYGVEKFGLNMQICNNIVYYSQTFDYQCKVRSLDSVTFNGMPSYMNIYDFWINTNLENLIKDNLEHKKDLLSNMYRNLNKIEVLRL